MINMIVFLKYHKKSQKQICIETTDHEKVTETQVAEIVSNKHIVGNAFTLKLLLTDLFKVKCFLEN